MASEKVTVTIASSIGEDAPLTVNDAMRQILDFFDLLAAAGGDEGALVAWQLVDISMNSPMRATAQAVATAPGVQAASIARREKSSLAHSIDQMVTRGDLPDWMDPHVRERAKTLFLRNTNGIGRTDIEFFENTPHVIIDQRQARAAVDAIERNENESALVEVDLSRTEIGSVEGNVLLTGPYRGQPAIRLRDRVSGSDVWCVFAPDLAQRIGPQHSWTETWANRRLLVSGRISYSKDGRVQHIYATDLEDIDPRPLKFGDIADPNFTGGLSPSEYIETLWEDEVG